MGRTEPCDHLGVRKSKCDKRPIVSRIAWLGSLGMECLGFVHGRRVATPDDRKPGDSGPARPQRFAQRCGRGFMAGRTARDRAGRTKAAPGN